MKTLFTIVFLLTSVFSAATAQKKPGQDKNFSKDQNAVMQVVLNVFDAMRAGDSTKLKKQFIEEPTMYTVYTNKAGQRVLHKGALAGFADNIGTPHEQVYDEKIWDYTVQIDGNLAQVWTQYAFYLGTAFSHCGVDALQLTKNDAGEWKIFHLADTRRKQGCQVPENLK